MLIVAMAFRRGSILAALMAKLPPPQEPVDAETAACAKPPAAADADDPDPFTVHKRVRAEEVRGGAEGFGIQVR